MKACSLPENAPINKPVIECRSVVSFFVLPIQYVDSYLSGIPF